MKPVRLLVLPLMLPLLAGCIRDEPPAPVVQTDIAPPTHLVPQAIETPPGKVTVRAGQSLYAVAREADVPVRTLIDANHLAPPYKLQVGQVLTVPATRQHVVQPGESLYMVARDYSVEASTLARENHLNPPYTLKNGTVLLLPPSAEPGSAPPPTMVAAAPPPLAPSSGSGIHVAPLPPPGKPAVQAPAVAAKPPTPLQPAGAQPIQTATLPPPTPAPAPVTPPEVTTPPPATPAPPPEPVKPPAAPVKPAPQPAATPPAEPETGAKPTAPTAEAAGVVAAAVASHGDPVTPIFQWPVRGKILSVFGTATGGTQNDGLNIAAPAGTTVSAAESGTVAYAGNELRGFGNLLLIKHADGWVTAYAHNDVLLVKKGQKVRRGEPIARVGSSGGVAQAQLHFELRRGTKAIDPLDHLPAPAAG